MEGTRRALGRAGSMLGGFWLNEDREFDTDRAQAVIRIVMTCVIGIYMLVLEHTALLPVGGGLPIALLSAVYIPFVLALSTWILRRPGKHTGRRALSIGADYVGLTCVLCFGGAAALPVFAIVVWVTVGNGLRFGPRYLLASTVLALTSMAVAATYNGYWREAPYTTTTVLLTAMLVPAYIYVLLHRLHRAYDEANEANLSKSRFLAQASHDLRQPIHAISLFTACLRDAGLQPRELQMVENIDRSLASVSRLFKSLLDVSTLDSGKVTPKPEVVAIAEIIDDIVRQNSEAAQRTGTCLHAVRSSLLVEVDRGLLTTMLQNVVNNAIKYAPGGGILIGCRRRNGTVSVGVYDQGPGIPAEHRARVFEEFYQVRARGDRDVEGVGLGLPIVSRLARLLGLRVSLRSEQGRGTCVELHGLPIAQRRERVEPRLPVRPTSAIDGLRVLLVEDDEAVLVATASLLRSWGCVVQAETAIPAVVEACDLLITDFDLGGGVTGADCIRMVRAAAEPTVPAVVMSGHDETRVGEDMGDPDVPILSKPVRPAELRSVILAKALDARQGQEAAA
jgi:signal transduction histidine kinase/CheY-like chemotaxis protein